MRDFWLVVTFFQQEGFLAGGDIFLTRGISFIPLEEFSAYKLLGVVIFLVVTFYRFVGTAGKKFLGDK